MHRTINAIKNWAIGIETTEKMMQIAKQNGYKLERDGDTIHATGNNSFSIRIK